MDVLLRRYRPRVEAVARKHASARVPAEDLVQDGLLEVFKAIQRFDPNGGAQLWTYARHSVEGAVSRSASGGNVIKLPVRVAALIPRVNATRTALGARLGREPTVAEVAAELGVPESRVAEVERHALGVLLLDEEAGWTVEREDPQTGAEFEAGDSGLDRYGTAEVKRVLRTYPTLLSRVLGSRDEALEGAAARPRRPGSWTHLRVLDLGAALERMPDRLYATVELAGLQDLSAGEAATRLGVSERTVYYRFRAGVEWLSTFLNDPDHALPVLRRIALPETTGLDAIAECVRRHRHVFEEIAKLDQPGKGEELYVKWVANEGTCVPVLATDRAGEAARPLLEVLDEISAPLAFTA
jgi:DNA-directed RNA polymerase specialized sigma subunit